MAFKISINSVEDSNIVSYRYERKINDIGRAYLIVDNSSGDKDDTYTLEAKGFLPVTIEDPVGTTRFSGRIIAIHHNGPFLSLECEDWLGQLKDKRITWDTRETLDDGTKEGTITSVDTANDYITDAGQAWPANTWLNEGKKLIITTSSGTSLNTTRLIYFIWPTEPNFDIIGWDKFHEVGSIAYIYAKDWSDYDHRGTTTWGGYYVTSFQYKTFSFDILFRSPVTANITSLTVYLAAYVTYMGTGGSTKFQIYDWDAATWDDLESFTSTGYKDKTYTGLGAEYVDSLGYIKLRITVNAPHANQTEEIYIDYSAVKIYYTSGYNASVYSVEKATGDDVYLDDDIVVNEIVNGDTYSVTETLDVEIKDLLAQEDYMQQIDTSNVATSTQAVLKEWKYTSPYQILVSLCQLANYDFWLDPDHKFYAGSYPATSGSITDADIISAMYTLQGRDIINNVIIEGDDFTFTAEDTESQSEYNNAVLTYYENDPHALSEHYADQKTTSIFTSQAYASPHITITQCGPPSKKLGDVFTFTCSNLGINSETYTVIRESYNHMTGVAELELTKQQGGSKIYEQRNLFSSIATIASKTSELEADR